MGRRQVWDEIQGCGMEGVGEGRSQVSVSAGGGAG